MSRSMDRPTSLLAVGLMAVVLAACGSSSKSSTTAKAPATPSAPATSGTSTTAGGTYPATFKRDFVAGCTQQHTPTSACECMVAYLQAHVPFNALKVDVAKNKTNSKLIQTAARSCKK